MAFYPMKCECGFYDPDWRCEGSEVRTQACPACGGPLQQDWIEKLRTVNLETDDTFGIHGHFNMNTGTRQGRSEYKKWVDGVKKKAKEEGREVHVGKDVSGPRKSRGERIADDVARHGKKAIDHYRLESKREQMKEKVARGERVA
jgi:hypothetical protein